MQQIENNKGVQWNQTFFYYGTIFLFFLTKDTFGWHFYLFKSAKVSMKWTETALSRGIHNTLREKSQNP